MSIARQCESYGVALACRRSLGIAGYFELPPNYWLQPVEVAELRAYCQSFCGIDSEYRLIDSAGRVHSVYLDPRDHVFDALCRLPRFLGLVNAALGPAVYVHQLKLNPKGAGGGTGYGWHRDAGYWRELDRLPNDSAITLAILLDDVDASMGPLLLAPGSHRLPEQNSARLSQAWTTSEQRGASTVVGELVTSEPEPAEQQAFVGRAGAALLFDSRLVHGSLANQSTLPRWVLYVTYNRLSNRPYPCPSPRPPLMSGRDFVALLPAAEGALCQALAPAGGPDVA